MEKNKLNFKILTSIFIVLFFIVFLHSSSYAVTTSESLQPIIDYLDNDSTFQDTLSNYSYCLLFNQNNNYFYNNQYFVFMTNTSPLNFIGTDNGSSFTINNTTNEDLYKLSLTYYRQGTISSTGYSSGSGAFGFNYSGDFNDYVSTITYVYKGNLGLSFNGTSVIDPVSEYDFSFVIDEESTNNSYTFNLTMEDLTFNNGVTLSSDDLKDGQFMVSISSLFHNTYNYGANDSFTDTYCYGFIDYIPYSDVSPKTQFYWSTGYNAPFIYNEDEHDMNVYRFTFKAMSEDSHLFDSLSEGYNVVSISKQNQYTSWNTYNYPTGSTFAYSNRDIYWAVYSSLYGFTELTSNPFFDESSYTTNRVYSIRNNNYYTTSESTAEDQETVFALGNNVNTYPSSNVSLTSDSLKDYSGSSRGYIQPYNLEYDDSGTNQLVEDTSNFGILDYVKLILNQFANLPNQIMKSLSKLFIPDTNEIGNMINDFSDFFEEHFGVLYDGIDFVITLFNTLNNKYSSNYSYYYFTIPGVRWFNPVTGQKQVLVESQTINLGAMYMDDEDWFFFWNTTRYLTSFLIYINLIMMAYNKYRAILGVVPSYSSVKSFIGDVGKSDDKKGGDS